jgi:hypothetical protein
MAVRSVWLRRGRGSGAGLPRRRSRWPRVDSSALQRGTRGAGSAWPGLRMTGFPVPPCSRPPAPSLLVPRAERGRNPPKRAELSFRRSAAKHPEPRDTAGARLRNLPSGCSWPAGARESGDTLCLAASRPRIRRGAAASALTVAESRFFGPATWDARGRFSVAGPQNDRVACSLFPVPYSPASITPSPGSVLNRRVPSASIPGPRKGSRARSAAPSRST